MPPSGLGIQSTPCSTCTSAIFCSPSCSTAAASDPASHCSLVCRLSQAINIAGLSDDSASELHYLIRACSLLAAASQGDENSKSRYTALRSLAGFPITTTTTTTAAASPSQQEYMTRQELHGRISHALRTVGIDPSFFSLGEVLALLERDAINGYGIMAPVQELGPGPGPCSGHQERLRLRGTGLYNAASRINHECLPNLARCDAFDSPAGLPGSNSAPGSNTALMFRALHAVPAGEEFTQSYFPLRWSYKERQHRTIEQYGFECACPRCKLEAEWQSAGGESEQEGGVEESDEESVQDMDMMAAEPAEDGEMTYAYIHTFLLKYVCPREECQGTMCPIPGRNDVCECTVCGLERTEEEFMAEVERELAGGDE